MRSKHELDRIERSIPIKDNEIIVHLRSEENENAPYYWHDDNGLAHECTKDEFISHGNYVVEAVKRPEDEE